MIIMMMMMMIIIIRRMIIKLIMIMIIIIMDVDDLLSEPVYLKSLLPESIDLKLYGSCYYVLEQRNGHVHVR